MAAPDQKLVDKVRKLLALAESSNEHEAAAAAARAAALMAQHHIAAASVVDDAGDEPIGEHQLDAGKRRVTWKLVLAAGICAASECRCYSSRRRVDGAVAVEAMVVGRARDVDTVRYMYRYLVREIERLAKAAWNALHPHERALESARAWKNGFRAGAATEIARRLRESHAEAMASARSTGNAVTNHALVRIDAHADALAAYLVRRGVGQRRAQAFANASGLFSGQRAGRAVNLGSNPALARPARQLGAGRK